jgi:peptide/histidine transporter 3/4
MNACRFLDKAAVKTGQTSPWMLCTVTQIEETKQMTKMIPILITTCIPSTIIAQTTTLFIRQGTTLDRRMGPHFKIPPACLIAFVNIFMLISVVIYDRVFVPAIRRYTENPRGITMLQRLGIGLVMHVIVMAVACLIERKRLGVARENNLLGMHDTIPLSILILVPQFALTGIADTFVDVAKLEFFYDQAPESMKSLGTSYFTTTLSIGNFLSTFLLSNVAYLTSKHGHKSWILDNLNVSRLDYYYAFLALLSVVNFICFFVIAIFFVYNEDLVVQTKMDVEMNPSSSKDKSGISQSISQLDVKS